MCRTAVRGGGASSGASQRHLSPKPEPDFNFPGQAGRREVEEGRRALTNESCVERGSRGQLSSECPPKPVFQHVELQLPVGVPRTLLRLP